MICRRPRQQPVADKNAGLHLAYYDAGTTHLVYAHRNPNRVWDKNAVIDAADAGQFVSLDLNSKGRPGIAYFDVCTAISSSHNLMAKSGMSNLLIAKEASASILARL